MKSLEILAAKADTEHVAIHLRNNIGRFLKANYVEAVTFAAGPVLSSLFAQCRFKKP